MQNANIPLPNEIFYRMDPKARFVPKSHHAGSNSQKTTRVASLLFIIGRLEYIQFSVYFSGEDTFPGSFVVVVLYSADKPEGPYEGVLIYFNLYRLLKIGLNFY